MWNAIYIIFLLCNILLLLWNSLSLIVILPLLALLGLAGAVWAVILPVKALRTKQRHWYWSLLPLLCLAATGVLHFLPLPWHIWNARTVHYLKYSERVKYLENPAPESIVQKNAIRTVIAFPQGESLLTNGEKKIVYISDDTLPQKEMFPEFVEKVTVYHKLAPKWYYIRIEY